MHFEFILLIIFFVNLRKNVQPDPTRPGLQKLFLAGIVFSALLLAASSINSTFSIICSIILYPVSFYLVYLCLTDKVFKPGRGFAIALLPYLLVSFLSELTRHIATKTYRSWNNYFEAANIFAIIWLIAMLVIERKQRKERVKQQLQAEERERAFQLSEKMKAELEVQVAERTADLNLQKEELQKTLENLKATQSQLIQSEKMASLGELTAGIAHEIQNPLNFVNNFSEVSNELVQEMVDEMAKGDTTEARLIAADIQQNLEKILHHGKRADAIVKGMLQHSRASTGIKEPTDINALADEYLRLAYHGLRAKNKSFNATIKTDFDPELPKIAVIPQEIGRVFLNLLTNAFYAVTDKKNNLTTEAQQHFEPTVHLSTYQQGDFVSISVKDNGNGIPQHAMDKIFQPFFTTKPTGQGTGLGLSMSFEIVKKGHQGELVVRSTGSEGTEFIVNLPK